MGYWDRNDVEFSELLGKTIIEISGKEGDDEINIKCSDGSVYQMLHLQNCCESVSIESITGDLQDLVGTPILMAEKSSSEKDPEGYTPPKDEYYRESFTWTFYKLATIKGYVDIRWYGSSNGYYSESVDFVKIK